MIDDDNDSRQQSHDEEPSKKLSTLFAKIPGLAGLAEKTKMSTLNFSARKIIIFILILVVLIASGIYGMHVYTANQIRKQAVSQVLAQAASMHDVQLYVGIIASTNAIKGNVDPNTQNGTLTFTAIGSKGPGNFTALLTNGRLSHLSLETADGKRHDVLADQTDYNADQAAKAALAAQAAQTVNDYNNAVTALRNKNYQAAIPGFQEAIQSKYQVAHSLNYLGFAYSQTASYQDCVNTYQQYVQLQTNDGEAYYQIAYCYLQMYQTDAALSNLDKACQLSYNTACQAAQQIRAATQKSGNAAEPGLSPQQSIQQQEQLQQQLQNAPSSTPATNAALPSSVSPATDSSAMPADSSTPATLPTGSGGVPTSDASTAAVNNMIPATDSSAAALDNSAAASSSAVAVPSTSVPVDAAPGDNMLTNPNAAAPTVVPAPAAKDAPVTPAPKASAAPQTTQPVPTSASGGSLY